MYVTWNNVQHRLFLHQFENKYTIFWVEVVSDLTCEFYYCVDISLNQILTTSVHLVQWHRGFFLGGGFKGLCTFITQNNHFTWCSDTMIVYSGSLTQMSIIKTHKIWDPGAVTLELFSWEFQTTDHSYQHKYLKSTCLLIMGWM